MIKLQSIYKKFKNKKRIVHALKDINLSFAKHGLCFIIGESGAGKSSLLNILSLQDTATSGSVILDDVDTLKLKRKDLATLRSKYFGIIFQNLNLINDFSVFTNISLGLEIQKKKVTREEVINILKRLNLSEDIIDEKVANLSGGQKQRVAIARALIKNPKVIICDEPTGSIDKKNAKEIMEILKDISKERLVIIVSHDLSLAETYGDRIITLDEGKIISDTNPFKNNKIQEKLEIGKHNHLTFASLIKLSFATIKHSIPKLIFTLIAFIITLSVFMASMTINSYDTSNAKELVIASDNVSYFTLERVEIKNSDTGINESGKTFNEDDIEKIKSYYDESLYILGHFNAYVSESAVLNYTYSKQENYYTRNISTINQNQLDLFGLELVGRLPKNDCYEIVLTNYICYKLGWLTLKKINDLNSLQSIINNYSYSLNYEYGLEPIKFDIVGIINTHRIINSDDSQGYAHYDTYADIYEMHNNLFFSEKVFKEILNADYYKGYSKVYISTINKNYSHVDSLLEQLKNENSEVKATSQVDFTLYSLKSLKFVYGTLTSAIAVFLFIISIFTLIGYTRFSIQVDMKNIIILRSLGLTATDSSTIFILQSIIISIFCIAFSIIPYSIALNLTNKYIMTDLMTKFVPLNFSIPLILLTFLGMTMLSSFIAIISIAIAFRKRTIKVLEY